MALLFFDDTLLKRDKKFLPALDKKIYARENSNAINIKAKT